MVPAQSEGSIAVPIKAAASETGKMTGLQSPPGIKRKSRQPSALWQELLQVT